MPLTVPNNNYSVRYGKCVIPENECGFVAIFHTSAETAVGLILVAKSHTCYILTFTGGQPFSLFPSEDLEALFCKNVIYADFPIMHPAEKSVDLGG